MAAEFNIEHELSNEKSHATEADRLLHEAQKVLIQSRLTDKNILDNLKFYKSSFEFLDEEEVPVRKTFSVRQIRSTAVRSRLRFLPSQAFEGDIPYEAVLKIKDLNEKHRKDLKHFAILSTEDFFANENSKDQALLFAKTLYGNYYHIHTWGNLLKKRRKLFVFPLRNFEVFAICILAVTLIECLSIPNARLSTDWRAGYFSMYRMAAYFHLLILNTGLLIFLLFAFNHNFSENNWDSPVKKKRH
jgi:hypothetical protein